MKKSLFAILGLLFSTISLAQNGEEIKFKSIMVEKSGMTTMPLGCTVVYPTLTLKSLQNEFIAYLSDWNYGLCDVVVDSNERVYTISSFIENDDGCSSEYHGENGENSISIFVDVCFAKSFMHETVGGNTTTSYQFLGYQSN